MSKHWPEPWQIKGDQLVAANGLSVAHVSDDDIDETFNAAQERANFERIASCVNACRGIAEPGTIPEIRETLRWIAQTVHNAHHQDQAGTFEQCPKNTCSAARVALKNSKEIT